MRYWRYRAYDELLKITEGVLASQVTTEEESYCEIFLKLRQQNLQCICLTSITMEEFKREDHLQRLRSIPVATNSLKYCAAQTTTTTRLTIRQRLQLIAAGILGRQ